MGSALLGRTQHDPALEVYQARTVHYHHPSALSRCSSTARWEAGHAR